MSTIKHQAIRLINVYLGEVSANAYAKFYKDKSDEVILMSVKELLSEVLGNKKALEVLVGFEKV